VIHGLRWLACGRLDFAVQKRSCTEIRASLSRCRIPTLYVIVSGHQTLIVRLIQTDYCVDHKSKMQIRRSANVRLITIFYSLRYDAGDDVETLYIVQDVNHLP